MNFRQRVVRGLLSSLTARAMSLVIQLVTIPVLVRTWGVQTYGEYLTLIALAAYLPLMTLGMQQAALSEMSIAFSRGESERYANALRCLFQAILGVSLVGLAVHLLVAQFAPDPAAGGRAYAAPTALLFLGLQQILQLNLGVATNAISATGRYGESQALDTVRLVMDGVALWTSVLLLGWGPDRTAMASATITGVFLGIAWLRFRLVAPHRPGLFRRGDWRAFAKLWRSVLGAFAMTNGYNVLIVHGPRLLLASQAGPGAVAVFAIVWTLLGVFRQGFEMLIQPLVVEFSYAFGAGARDRAERMLGLGLAGALAICLGAAAPLFVFAPWIFDVATDGKLQPPLTLLAILWAVLLAYTASAIFHIALLATNRAQAALPWLVPWTLLSAAAACGLAAALGLYGVALGLLLFQLGFSVVVTATALKVFGLTLEGVVGRLRTTDVAFLLQKLGGRRARPE